MITDNLVRLTKAQVKQAGEMFARVFQDYPLLTYVIPDATERENISHVFFEVLVRYGVLYGEVYAISSNLEGVAMWLPSEKADMTLWRMIRCGVFSLLFKLGKKAISRIKSYSDYAFSMHKRHAPFRHWYLSFIGVDPMFQGKGYASTMLRTMFTRIDQEHLPCYLETHNEKNVSIFQHYGFKIVEEDVIPGTEINHWAMLREKSSLYR